VCVCQFEPKTKVAIDCNSCLKSSIINRLSSLDENWSSILISMHLKSSLSLSLSLSKLEKSMGRSILGLSRIAQEFHKNRGKKITRLMNDTRSRSEIPLFFWTFFFLDDKVVSLFVRRWIRRRSTAWFSTAVCVCVCLWVSLSLYLFSLCFFCASSCLFSSLECGVALLFESAVLLGFGCCPDEAWRSFVRNLDGFLHGALCCFSGKFTQLLL
jgi:hypothetical protein